MIEKVRRVFVVGGVRRDLTWAGLSVVGVGMNWEETRAAKMEVRRVREKSMLLVLIVDVRKVGLVLRIRLIVETVDGVVMNMD